MATINLVRSYLLNKDCFTFAVLQNLVALYDKGNATKLHKKAFKYLVCEHFQIHLCHYIQLFCFRCCKQLITVRTCKNKPSDQSDFQTTSKQRCKLRQNNVVKKLKSSSKIQTFGCFYNLSNFGCSMTKPVNNSIVKFFDFLCSLFWC